MVVRIELVKWFWHLIRINVDMKKKVGNHLCINDWNFYNNKNLSKVSPPFPILFFINNKNITHVIYQLFMEEKHQQLKIFYEQI